VTLNSNPYQNRTNFLKTITCLPLKSKVQKKKELEEKILVVENKDRQEL